jgi:hypothetical protein
MPRAVASGVSVILASAALLLAVDPPWVAKPAPKWTDDEAKQVLYSSPWAKEIKADLARRQTEDELRAGGQMGQPTGFGYQNVDPKGSGYRPQVKNIFTGKGGNDRSARSRPQPGIFPLGLRWESALPIRLAKFKFDSEPLGLDGDGYQIGVYGVPDADGPKGDSRKMGEPLMQDAYLRREGKKDVKPIRVEVFRRENGPVIIYMFPLSAELSKKDGSVLFQAQIGRIVIHQNFDLTMMDYLGKLEL